MKISQQTNTRLKVFEIEQTAPVFEIINCDYCKAPSEKTKRCSDCKFARYCSTQCQYADWKTHKSICAIFKEYHPDLKDLIFEINKRSVILYFTGLEFYKKFNQRGVLVISKTLNNVRYYSIKQAPKDIITTLNTKKIDINAFDPLKVVTVIYYTEFIYHIALIEDNGIKNKVCFL